MDLETNASKGGARENSLHLQKGEVRPEAVVKMAQTFRSGTNDIDALDFAELFLTNEEQVNPDEAAPLIARGARIDIWAAANLGMITELAVLIARDPSLVHAKGGDGKRPMHFARTVPIAQFLLEHGAEINAQVTGMLTG